MSARPVAQPPPPPLGGRIRELLRSLIEPQVASAARERRDLLVLLAAVALVALPHFAHLPPWSSLLLALLWLWRITITLQRRPPPGRLLMMPLLAAATAAVWLQHGTLLGRDAGTNFLLLLLGLKLLEMRARRDVFVVVFLSFFILLTQFLYDQGLAIAAVALLSVVALFFVLLSVHLAVDDLPAAAKLRLIGATLLKALPLTAALFLLFPRLSAPFWGLPGDPASATSGLGNSMAPGTISRMFESQQIVLRAQFSGAVPRQDQLYWRGPVFGRFDGRTWSPLDDPAGDRSLNVQVDPASAVDHEVTLEPTRRSWVFALEAPAPVVHVGDTPLPVRLTADMQLVADRTLNERLRYTVRSYLKFRAGADAEPAALRPWVELPAGYNPRTLQFAAALRERALPAGAAASPGAAARLVSAVLEHLRQGGYRYTLSPPVLGRHTVDEFLFDTRQGFCEHYASAFVVLMRALDVPARVVTGYQGGEVHPVDGYLTVRQGDAHAWAEVWLEGNGWTRLDPTAIVSPLRIDRGAPEFARRSGLRPLLDVSGPVAWLRQLRLNWEALDNAWNQWVLSYSGERQRALLDWIGLPGSIETLAWVFALVTTLLLGVLAALSLHHRVVRDPLAVLDGLLRDRLLAAGLQVAPTWGPREAVARLHRQLQPGSRSEVAALFGQLEQARYARGAPRLAKAELRALRRRIARLRPRAAVDGLA